MLQLLIMYSYPPKKLDILLYTAAFRKTDINASHCHQFLILINANMTLIGIRT